MRCRAVYVGYSGRDSMKVPKRLYSSTLLALLISVALMASACGKTQPTLVHHRAPPRGCQASAAAEPPPVTRDEQRQSAVFLKVGIRRRFLNLRRWARSEPYELV